MSRLKNPDLLRELKPLWRESGCAVCGRSVTDDVPPGMDVELAHFERRSQLGPDDAGNIIGLCGELTDCKAHSRFDRYSLAIKRDGAGGFVWMDLSPGGHLWQACRMPPEVSEMLADADDWNLSPRDGAALAAALDTSVVVNGLAVTNPTAGPVPLPPSDSVVSDRTTIVSRETPAVDGLEPAAAGEPFEQRYTALRGLVQRSERDRLAAAMLLWEAREQRDHERLDQTWPEYVSGAGLSKSAASKMLAAADCFRGEWLQLAQVDQADLNLERVYLASRLVTEQGLETMDALHEAVASPSHMLVAQLKHDEPAERCVCSDCGANHAKRVAG